MKIWTDSKTGQRFEVKIEEDEPFIESKVKVMTNGGKVILQAGLIQRSYHQIKGRFNEIRALPRVYQGY